MLGRLRMSVRDCLKAYRELSKEVFDINAFNVAFNVVAALRLTAQFVLLLLLRAAPPRCTRCPSSTRRQGAVPPTILCRPLTRALRVCLGTPTVGYNPTAVR